MNNIEIEINDQSITKQGVKACVEFYRTIAKAKFESPDICAFVTGVDSPFLNAVFDTRTNIKMNSKQVQLITDFFEFYQVPWVWFLTPLAKMNDLEQHGLTLLEEAPGMYFDLLDPLLALNEMFSIKEMEINSDLSEWIDPINEGFPGSDNGEIYRKLNADLLNNGQRKLKHFVAYFQNQVAGSATLFLGEEAVMLHNLAIKKVFQKRGIGKALAIHRMVVAKQLGYRHCFLDASEEGYEVYKRLGLKVYSMTKAYMKK